MVVVERYFSTLVDLFFSGLILLLHPLEVLTATEVVLALLVFVVTPEFIRPDQPQCRGLSGRKPGLFFTTAAALSFAIGIETGTIIFFGISLVMGAFIYLTSKFSLQAFAFIFLFYTLYDSVALLILLGSFLLALLLSNFKYLGVFTGHITHLYDYAVNKQFKISYTKPSLKLFSQIKKIRSSRDILEFVYKSNVIRSLLNNPFILGVAGIYLLSYMNRTKVSVANIFEVWIIGGVAAYILTSLPYLRFLGEAERYLEYVFLPSSIVLVKSFNLFDIYHTIIFYSVIGIGIVIAPVYLWAFKNEFYNIEREDSLREVINFLNNHKSGTVVLQPIWKGRRIAWETSHKVVDAIMNGNSTPDSIIEFNRLFPREYGVVTGDIKWIEQTYNPDWIVFDKLKSEDITCRDLEKPDLDPIFENNYFAIYHFREINRIE